MGVNKDTKIFYKHGDADAFAAVGGQSTTGSITANLFTDKAKGWKEADSFTYRNEDNNADITKASWKEVMADLVVKHTGGNKNAYAVGVAPLATFASIEIAKNEIFGPNMLAAYDTHCDRQEWALVDGDTGLKHTRDWKIENNASLDGHYAQFKTEHDGKWGAPTDYYLGLGAFITDDSSHLF